MAELDLKKLLNDISPETPCGINVEEEADFLLLETKSRFVDERQMGDSIIPAEEPDWKVIRSLSLKLLERTRDIQVAMHLTCSLLRTDGFNGLNQGLTLIKVWLEKYWDTVYPLQDPEDKYPVLRVNTLDFLKDYTLILGPINHTPLTKSPIGDFSWRDIELAEGKISPLKDEQQLEMSVIEAAFLDTDFEILQNQSTWINQAREQIKGMSVVVTDKADAINAPDLSSLNNLLHRISCLLDEKIKQRQALEEKNDDIELTTGTSTTENSNQHIKHAAINNRADVIRNIDEICKYFDRYEPSSPVPFLLLRAKKILAMNFMEILRDFSPDTVSQAEKICGVQNDDKKD